MMKVKKWRQSDREVVQRAIANGKPLMVCGCCGGRLPPLEAWRKLRELGRGPDCTGSVTMRGDCHAFAELM